RSVAPGRPPRLARLVPERAMRVPGRRLSLVLRPWPIAPFPGPASVAVGWPGRPASGAVPGSAVGPSRPGGWPDATGRWLAACAPAGWPVLPAANAGPDARGNGAGHGAGPPQPGHAERTRPGAGRNR